MNYKFDIQPQNLQIAKYKQIINQYLSKEEIKKLHQKSNLKAIFEIVNNWLWIVFAFIMVYFYANIFTIILALLIIGGKQLGCAIIMHDTSHSSLFKSKKANLIIGNIFGAYPLIHNVRQYAPYHLQHHMATGTADDPDINLANGYPAKFWSMMRKFFRDLVGATGLKGFLGVLLMHFGYWQYSLGNKIIRIKNNPKQMLVLGFKNLFFPVIWHICFFLIFYFLQQPKLYFLWWIAFFTTYNFCLRVRAIAEHSVVEDNTNPYKNTRTTYANFFERIFFAPLHVNYHLEHHFMIAAPSYNYPKLHKILKARGFYKIGLLKENYWQIIKMAILQ